MNTWTTTLYLYIDVGGLWVRGETLMTKEGTNDFAHGITGSLVY